ncbi:MAG: hypothetical protein JNM55_17550 [Anaerolineales bacterium]|nr:hypothetical protein [Anaerolineales bacterium]
MFVSLFVVSVLFLASCGGNPAEQSGNEQPAAQDSASTEAPVVASEFFLQITNIKGTVEVRASANDSYAPAQVGQRLAEGAQIRTGVDGIVALYRDALTMMIVDNNSEAQIKTLRGTVEVPITVVNVLNGAVALEHHAEKLPEGSILSVETPEGNTGEILGSTVRVQYNPETKIMTATCLTGTCEFVRGDQKLTLEAGQAVDVTGLQPPPGAPSEMTTEQANQFLAMGGQLCGCEITIGEIRDGGLEQTSPPPADLGGTEASATEVPATEAPSGDPVATEAPSGDSGDGGDSGGNDSGGSDG